MKKLVFTILLAVFLILASHKPASATAINLGFEELGDSLDELDKGSLNSSIHTYNVKEIEVGWLLCKLGEAKACTNDPKKLHSYYQNSVMGSVQNGIAALYLNKPADTQQFIAYYGQKVGIVKPALAQGIGFSGLSPLLGLWRGFRNIAYGFLILVMVGIGFAVLFRTKIDPRTVISIQNALPRVIVTLILITFSYAIVGLLIDLMYLSIFLIVAVFNGALPTPIKDLSTVLTQYTGGSLGTVFSAMMTPGSNAVNDVAAIISGIPVAGQVSGLIFALVGGWL